MTTTNQKLHRELRISGHKDYFAIDLVDDSGRIHSTPFYIRAGHKEYAYFKDQETGKLMKTECFLPTHCKNLACKDTDGWEWEQPFDELLIESYLKFIKP